VTTQDTRTRDDLVVVDPALAAAAAGRACTVPADALVVDLAPDQVLLGERGDPEAWPPASRSSRLGGSVAPDRR
jgi:hypothetical protein